MSFLKTPITKRLIPLSIVYGFRSLVSGLSYVRMCFRQLKNKDEDRVVENNECLPHAMLGSYNDLARPLHKNGMKDCVKVDFVL
ncbi:hypothetical protein YC2023_122232 [Brassica napus]